MLYLIALIFGDSVIIVYEIVTNIFDSPKLLISISIIYFLGTLIQLLIFYHKQKQYKIFAYLYFAAYMLKLVSLQLGKVDGSIPILMIIIQSEITRPAKLEEKYYLIIIPLFIMIIELAMKIMHQDYKIVYIVTGFIQLSLGIGILLFQIIKLHPIKDDKVETTLPYLLTTQRTINIKLRHSSQQKIIAFPQERKLIYLNEDFTIYDSNVDLKCYLTYTQFSTSCLEMFLSCSINIYKTTGTQIEVKIKEYLEGYDFSSNVVYATFQRNQFMLFPDNIISISNYYKDEIHLYQLELITIPLKIKDRHKKKYIGSIFKSLSHELGTNLNSIITFSNTAIDDQEITEESKDRYFKPIKVNSEQLYLIVCHIRDYNLCNMNQLVLKIEEFDVVEEIYFIDSLFENAVKNKNIRINHNFNIVCNIFANDKQRFRQIYFQLLQNAVKFTIKGEIIIEIQCEMDFCVISVSDTGIGMTNSEQTRLERMFVNDCFEQVSSNSVGSGLGLVITNLILRSMNNNNGDNITISKKDIGTQFTVKMKNNFDDVCTNQIKRSVIFHQNSQTIQFMSANTYIEGAGVQVTSLPKIQQPIPRSNNNLLAIVEKNSKSGNSSRGPSQQQLEESDIIQQPPLLKPKLQDHVIKYSLKSECCSRILIMDDEYFNIQCLLLILKGYKTKCDYVYNGEEALMKVFQKKDNPCSKCKNNNYQVFFIDLNMPVMDGYETVLELRKLMQNNIITYGYCVANTGFSDLDTKIKSYQAGMDYFLTKPLDQKQIKNILFTIFK